MHISVAEVCFLLPGGAEKEACLLSPPENRTKSLERRAMNKNNPLIIIFACTWTKWTARCSQHSIQVYLIRDLSTLQEKKYGCLDKLLTYKPSEYRQRNLNTMRSVKSKKHHEAAYSSIADWCKSVQRPSLLHQSSGDELCRDNPAVRAFTGPLQILSLRSRDTEPLYSSVSISPCEMQGDNKENSLQQFCLEKNNKS